MLLCFLEYVAFDCGVCQLLICFVFMTKVTVFSPETVNIIPNYKASLSYKSAEKAATEP